MYLVELQKENSIAIITDLSVALGRWTFLSKDYLIGFNYRLHNSPQCGLLGMVLLVYGLDNWPQCGLLGTALLVYGLGNQLQCGLSGVALLIYGLGNQLTLMWPFRDNHSYLWTR